MMTGLERLAVTVLITILCGTLGFCIGATLAILIFEKLYLGAFCVVVILALVALDQVWPYAE